MSKTLLITEDFGSVRKCKTREDMLAVSRILISAQPDCIAMDVASPDLVNYDSKIGLRIPGDFDALFNEGCDPFGFMVDTLKEADIRVLANVRMNDHHGRPAYWTQWEQEHVDWSLSQDTGTRDWKAIGALRHMDYAIEGVRSYRLSIMKEIVSKFDVDGIQLDFGRTAPFVSDPKPENGRFMTEYIRSVRTLLDDSNQSDNRKTLGVLLPWDIDFCSNEGLEVKRWVNEGLVDYISPGEWYYSDWNIPQQAWIDMTKGTACQFYPFTPGNVSPYQDFEFGEPSALGENNILDGAKIRAIADNFEAQGSDGFAFYNFYTFDFGQLYPELRKWVNPEESKSLSRHYLNCRRLIYHATEREAYDLGLAFERSALGAAGDEISLPFRFSSQVGAKRIVLRCAFIGAEAGDEIEVNVNGITLDPIHSTKSNEGSTTGASPTIIWEGALKASILNSGQNTLQLKLVKVSGDRSTPIKVGEYEIFVDAD